MEHWKRWALIMWALWLVVAMFVAWQRSTCGAPWSSACLQSGWQSFGDVLLLGWVQNFQEFLAGIFALTAGAFVLVATRIQLNDTKAQRIEEAKQKKLSTISACRSDLIHAMNHLQHSEPLASTNELPFIRAALPELASINGSLMHITYSVLYRVEAALKKRLEPGWPVIAKSMEREMLRCAAAAGVLAELLHKVGGEIDEGVFNGLKSETYSAEVVEPFLIGLGLLPSEIRELSVFFRWTNYR